MPTFIPPPDMWIVEEILEPLTQKIQKYIGLDCFFFATLSLYASLVCATLSMMYLLTTAWFAVQMGHVLETVWRSLFFWFFNDLRQGMWISLTTHSGHSVSAVKELAYAELANGRKNPLLFCHRPMMYFSGLCMMVLIFEFEDPLISILVGLVIKGTFFIGYMTEALLSCTPLPEEKSKLRKGLDAFKKFLGGLSDSVEPFPEPTGA